MPTIPVSESNIYPRQKSCVMLSRLQAAVPLLPAQGPSRKGQSPEVARILGFYRGGTEEPLGC